MKTTRIALSEERGARCPKVVGSSPGVDGTIALWQICPPSRFEFEIRLVLIMALRETKLF